MKHNVVIATISWIRTRDEAKVVMPTIELLNQLNVPVVMIDAGSPVAELEKIKTFKNIALFETREGLTEQLTKSHYEAAQRGEYIFYLHSDKYNFVKDVVPTIIEVYSNLNNKGVLVPTRTKESFSTYPQFQQKEEEFLNFFMGDYIGTTADYYAGPKIYPASLVKYLDTLHGDIGWGIEAYFYALAKRLGLPFDFFPCFIQSPVDVGNEEKIKKYRLKVIEWQIEGLLQGQEVHL